MTLVLSLLGALLLASGADTGGVNVRDYGAVGDGRMDDLAAINRAIAAVHGKGQRLLFPAGTYGVSGTVVIPNKTQITGVGRGDPGGPNTVIQALPSFPRGGTLVQMGTAPGPNFGVQLENLTIHGSAIAGVCLANSYAQEQSFARNVVLAECWGVGLRVEGGAAQNSGPFENLEIFPAAGRSTTEHTRCVEVHAVGAFRGIRGLTCNAGSGYATRPDVALKIDGTGTYQDIHVEHFATAVELGTESNAAAGLIFANGVFGPDVTTGIAIAARRGVNNQNLTILGLACAGCKVLLDDGITGTKISDVSLGWYLLGNGAGRNKAVWSSNYGIGTQIFAPFRAPQVQFTSEGGPPACSDVTRGTFWFVRSGRGEADHVAVCRKSAAETYSWVRIF